MKKVAVTVITLLLVILFTHAGLIKLLDHRVFLEELRSYPLLAPFAGPIARGLPTAELILATLLMWPRTRFLGLSLALLLMAVFAGYIIFLLNGAYQVPCTCETLLGFTTWTAQLKFNLVFLLVALSGFLLQLIMREEERVMHLAR
ncbi:MauE/DoxX family redox-associated membrane protein [Chitinophaga japonensis]|uniref:Methylamine utilization protein MauE n=1 Tax=Chitinophaga japonensis TaxID=104662 RepID=A0A562T089_CHIJA|nr:MauE/DoxX family redox-associated membrane protein [Chitinophaga japonensis]TWI86718.1 methylamine utilization protein MauE [Chitinophaga japonensis]